jgi:LDH2 family malate/lactate/ureidoglycolate dehydrogenase
MDDRNTVPHAALQTWIAAVFTSCNTPAADAAIVAEALLDSSLHGVDTHGIGLLPAYLDRLARGITNARPDIAIATHGALLKVDADRGLGQVVIVRVLDRAMQLARSQGSVTAVVDSVGHLGALGYFTRKASAAGMLALLMQNGPPVMGLPGSKQRAIGNNPMSFAVPVAGRAPIVFDAATSEAAYGKVIQAGLRGEAIPANWAMDGDGRETRDPHAAANGILLPFGGFKGIGLAMMIEAFAGSLTGKRPVWDSHISGAFLLVVNPDAAIERARFETDVADWLDRYVAASPDGRYPGEQAAAVYERRSREGIPVGTALRKAFRDIGRAAGSPFPA